MQKALILV